MYQTGGIISNRMNSLPKNCCQVLITSFWKSVVVFVFLSQWNSCAQACAGCWVIQRYPMRRHWPGQLFQRWWSRIVCCQAVRSVRSRPFYTHFQTFNKTICVIVSVADLFLSGIIEKCSSSDTAARENQSKFVFIRAFLFISFPWLMRVNMYVSSATRSEAAAWKMRILQRGWFA